MGILLQLVITITIESAVLLQLYKIHRSLVLFV